MTLQRPQSVPAPGDHVEFDDKVTATPLFTILMILWTVACYVFSAKREEFWLAHNGWSISAVADLINAHNYASIVNLLGTANFGTFNMIHMGLSMYFLWVFGGHVEGKISSGRYLPLVLGGLTIPWAVLQFEAARQPQLIVFGPLFLLCAVIGAYVVVPPQPLKRYGTGSVTPKNQIFKKEERKDPRTKYIANPWTFLAVFAIVQLFFHFWCTTGIINPMEAGKYLLPPFGKDYDIFRLLPCIVAFGIGYLTATLAVSSASQALNEGPLAIQALRRYRELLDLDVKHEEAIRGTARTLGLSYDKTKELVMKNKNKMRIK